MKETVRDFVYKGRSFSFQPTHPNNPERCQFEVAEVGRMTVWHQCSRKFVEVIDGFGFCKQHASEVKRRLGISKGEIVRYIARFRNGNPELTRVQIESETEKTITVIDSEVILGSYVYIGTGRQNKSQFNVFETEKEALIWLYKESRVYFSHMTKLTQKAQETVSQLEAMVKEEKQ